MGPHSINNGWLLFKYHKLLKRNEVIDIDEFYFESQLRDDVKSKEFCKKENKKQEEILGRLQK